MTQNREGKNARGSVCSFCNTPESPSSHTGLSHNPRSPINPISQQCHPKIYKFLHTGLRGYPHANHSTQRGWTSSVMSIAGKPNVSVRLQWYQPLCICLPPGFVTVQMVWRPPPAQDPQTQHGPAFPHNESPLSPTRADCNDDISLSKFWKRMEVGSLLFYCLHCYISLNLLRDPCV